MLSRREFLAVSAKSAVLGGSAAFAFFPRADPRLSALAATSTTPTDLPGVPARFWARAGMPGVECRTCHSPVDLASGRPHQHEPATVRCLLCAQACTIKAGARGQCRARVNVRGELRSLVYGRPTAVHVDPIEKKPFYHFLPGAAAFSFSTSGCPLRCRFCQNWELSQASPEDFDGPFVPSAEMVRQAADRQAPIVAFTYNEPTVSTEYVIDVAREAHRLGLRTALVSCGFMNGPPLAEMCGVLDAIKIDLKGFTESFYRDVCGASLAPVLRSLAQVRASGRHLEIVNLVVPTLNDGEASLKDLSTWVVRELGPDVPVHFTRFHPDYQLQNLPPTPVPTLERARGIAMAAGVRYAYVGNVPGHEGNHTYCPGCRRAVVKRTNFFVTELHVTGGRCEYCRQPIAGVWS
jgi:pyruvate formate lyase activating enzyme